MPHWVIEGTLARTSRPGYAPGPEHRVGRATVDAWLESLHAHGIVSILCLLDRDQLHLYEHELPDGLIAYYQDRGFHVGHVPTFDGQSEPFDEAQYGRILAEFRQLPKPVLVHCSAGFDRTGRAVDHILASLETASTDAAGN